MYRTFEPYIVRWARSFENFNNEFCYTSQLKYVFWLEENVSRVIGQNFMTPEGNNNLNFRLTRDQVVHLWNGGKSVRQPTSSK